MSDSLNQLADVLYGRAAMPADYIGGSDARIFHDAADRIAALETEVIPRATIADALAELQGTIAAHDVRLESCDRDGNEYCDCLERAIAKLNAEVTK